MNHGPLLFLGILFSLAASWLGMIVGPQLQFGRQPQVSAGPANPRYPLARPGFAQQGREIYRANGCFYCHSQQVRADVGFDVVLSSAGTNKTELVAALLNANAGLSADAARKLVEEAPKRVFQGLAQEDAAVKAKSLSVPDAKVAVVVAHTGADIERGWGKRFSVAQDYLLEQPLMLGRQRLGPDLANIGGRLPDGTRHLLHLYNPKITAPGSTMPSYPFLFEKRKLIGRPSPDALKLEKEFAPEAGYEIVPKPEGRALVAYLLSLQSDVSLFEAPLPAGPKKDEAGTSTNQPSSGPATNSAGPIPSAVK
jgi:cbb3-type cytochrome oxidase cytochrome c subunit